MSPSHQIYHHSVADAECHGLEYDDYRAEIIPSRGALCVTLTHKGEHFLYLDPSTLSNPAANVRGGIPVLFPICGKSDTNFVLRGAQKPLPQHGFARNRAFQVVSSSTTSEETRLGLKLLCEPSEFFPFRTSLEVQFVLDVRGLTLEARIRNGDALPMPFQLGWHPYFRLEPEFKSSVRLATDATRAFDQTQNIEVSVGEALLTDAREVNLHLLNHTPKAAVVRLSADRHVELRYSDPFDTLVLWSLPTQPFVCIEPWLGTKGALRDNGPRCVSGDGEERLFFTIKPRVAQK